MNNELKNNTNINLILNAAMHCEYLSSIFGEIAKYPWIGQTNLEFVTRVSKALAAAISSKETNSIAYFQDDNDFYLCGLTFKEFCLLFFSVCLAYPDWQLHEDGESYGIEWMTGSGEGFDVDSGAYPYVIAMMHAAFEFTEHFSYFPGLQSHFIKLDLSLAEYRYLASCLYWYMHPESYINFGRNIDWNYEETFTILLEEVFAIGRQFCPDDIPKKIPVIDLNTKRDWIYPTPLYDSIADAANAYKIAKYNNQIPNEVKCINCGHTWPTRVIDLFLVCEKCQQAQLNPHYLDKRATLKDKDEWTCCNLTDHHPGTDEEGGACIYLHVEHYFILLATVLMAPESMHTSTKKLFKKKVEELEFPEAKTLKTKFMEALLNMRESDVKETTCTARLKTMNYKRTPIPV